MKAAASRDLDSSSKAVHEARSRSCHDEHDYSGAAPNTAVDSDRAIVARLTSLG